MSTRTKIILMLLLFVTFVVGLFLGILWKDFPYVKFNSEVKIFEVANFLLTLTIGVTIPLLVKKWIEDGRYIKISLVDEVKNIMSTIVKIKTKIGDCYSNSKIVQKDKDDINYFFHEAELLINSFCQQIEISYKLPSQTIIKDLKEKYHTYKDYLTGGEFMISSFKIDDRFYREHNNEAMIIETHLKMLIHKIHRL